MSMPCPFWSGCRGGACDTTQSDRLRLLVNIGLIVASMNAWHFVRNWNAFNNVLGPPESVQSVANEVISPAIVLSNVIRNVALHLPTPSRRVNNWSFRVIRRIHRAIGVDLNDPADVFRGRAAAVSIHCPAALLQEDLTGNGLHLVLLTLSIAFLLTGTRGTDSRPARMYAIALLAGFGLFCDLQMAAMGEPTPSAALRLGRATHRHRRCSLARPGWGPWSSGTAPRSLPTMGNAE